MFTSAQGFINSPLYPVMIISYEMFLRSVEEVRNIKFGLVVCDEAHRLKNTNIKTATVSPVTPTLQSPSSFTSPPPPPNKYTPMFLSFFYLLFSQSLQLIHHKRRMLACFILEKELSVRNQIFFGCLLCFFFVALLQQ